jgi:hypothetical protein
VCPSASLPDRRHATQEPFIDFVVAGGECPFTLHAPLVELDRIRALGGFDETMTTGAVDWDLWYRMMRNGYVFVPSKTLGAIYRQKSGGITRSNKAGHTQASAKLIRAAYAPVDPGVMVAPTAFPMPEPLGSYQAKLVVAGSSDPVCRHGVGRRRHRRHATRHSTSSSAERGRCSTATSTGPRWWAAAWLRVVGLRPKDVPDLAEALAPFVHTVRQATWR